LASFLIEVFSMYQNLYVEAVSRPASFPIVEILSCGRIHEQGNCRSARRAIEKQVYAAAVNRVGEDEGLVFGELSILLDPYGTVLVFASEIDETLLVG
jgi:predicted amidohydrolase